MIPVYLSMEVREAQRVLSLGISMDINTLYEIVKELNIRVSTLEQGLASVVATVDWLSWWMKILVGGSFLNVVVAGFNSVLLYRNGKK